jgi:hypothetical protein
VVNLLSNEVTWSGIKKYTVRHVGEEGARVESS